MSLSSGVFERSTLTGSGLFFAHLSHDFEQTFSHIVSIRVKTLSNTNLVSSRNIKRKKGSFAVDVRRSKTFGWLSSRFVDVAVGPLQHVIHMVQNHYT